MKYFMMCVGAIVFLPSAASATTDSNRSIAHVGAQGSSGYITLTTATSVTCTYNNLYFDLTTDAGKSYMAIAMTAWSAGRPISRIDYTVSGGVCNVQLLEL